jgi:hypothetical protein
MSSDDKKNSDELDPTTGNLDRRAFLQILGAAFSAAALPEALTACSEAPEQFTVDGVEALTARQTVSVVRPEDLLVLTLGFVNLKRSANRQLVKVATAYPAYIIVDFPAQAIVEDAVTYTATSDPPDPNNPPIPLNSFSNAWLGGNSRIIFQLPDDYAPVSYALSAILGVCAASSVVVADAMKETIATTVLPPAASGAPALIENKLNALSADIDPAASARKMALEQKLDGIAAFQKPYNGVASAPPELGNGNATKIEIPYRLQLSPNCLAGWAHATTPVLGTTGATEVWHTRLGARTVAPNVAGTVDERNAYLRTVRALSTRDNDPALVNNSTVGWDPPSVKPLQNPSLEPLHRRQIVEYSSKLAGARAIQVNRLMLSSLGGYLDAHAEFPPDSNLASWVHKMAGGRENYVQTSVIGALLPFGNVATRLQITTRNDDPKRGAIGVLYKYDVIIIRNPVLSFRPSDYKASTRGALLRWPFTSVELKQTYFVAQTTPATVKDYWPVDLSGTPIMVPAVGYDQRGHAIHFSVPLYFVVPPVAPNLGAAVTNYRNKLLNPPIKPPRTAAVPSIGITAPGDTTTSLNLAMGGQRIAYAYSKRDDTTFATRALYVNLASADETFPYVPVVSGTVLDVEALHSFTDGQSITATYHPKYATAGLDPAQNKSQLLFKLAAPVKADFRNRPDGGTGFVAPNIAFTAISRTTGPSHDYTQPSTALGHLVHVAPAKDGGFDPASYLNLAAEELDKIRIFGVFRLIDIIKAVDPDEAANDMKGLTKELGEAALRYAPKFITEALNEIEKILSTIAEVKGWIESIWTNAKEILGSQYVEALAASIAGGNPNPGVNSAVAGMLGNADGIGDDQWSAVVEKLTITVIRAQLLYKSLVAALDHLEHLDFDALAGSPAPADGSFRQIFDKGVALKDAIVDLATFAVRANVDAKDALVGAATSEAGLKVVNALIQIAPGLKDGFLAKFGALQEIIGDVSDVAALATRLKKIFDEAKQAIHSLSDMTVKIDWHPKIGSYYLPGTDWLVFRPATQHALALSMEARTKSKNGKQAGVDVSCRLDHFDLCLGPLDSESKSVIAMQFDHISFTALAGKKPDVDVKINGIEFGGPLGFLQTLRKLIPLDGFSDPPYLKIDSGGIHAGFSCHIPNIAIGVFSMENLSLSAKLEIPFFSDGAAVRTLLFTFSFCDKDHPFLITVSMLGGGGYFVFSLTPSGIESLEASICVGAQVAFSVLDIAQGNITITVGITFTIKDVTDASGNALGKDISLSAFFRLHGQLDVMGIVSVSIDVRLTMTYDITTKTMVAEGEISIDVSVLFFSLHRSVHVRKEFHACNNDPTLRQLMPPNELNVSESWTEYCNAYA